MSKIEKIENFYPNGMLREKGTKKDGKPVGKWIGCYESGEKKFEGVCRNDKLFGEWTFYNADGSVEKIKEYTN